MAHFSKLKTMYITRNFLYHIGASLIKKKKYSNSCLSTKTVKIAFFFLAIN